MTNWGVIPPNPSVLTPEDPEIEDSLGDMAQRYKDTVRSDVIKGPGEGLVEFGIGILLSLLEDGSFSSEDSLQIAVAKGFFYFQCSGGKVEGRYQRQQTWPLASGLIDIKNQWLRSSVPGLKALHLFHFSWFVLWCSTYSSSPTFLTYWRWDSSQVSLQIPYAISDIKIVGFSTKSKRSPNFKTRRIIYSIHINCHPSLLCWKPEPRWVKRLKRLKCEEEVWWLRIPSEFDAMRSLTSHLWVYWVAMVTWWHYDLMLDDWWPTSSKTEKSYTLMSFITSGSNFSCRLDMWIVTTFLINVFLKSLLLLLFFHDSELRSHHDIFTAFCCQGPEELTMCRACCGPSALHPEERPCVTENNQMQYVDEQLIPKICRRCWFNFVYHICNSESIVLLWQWFYSTHVSGICSISEELLEYIWIWHVLLVCQPPVSTLQDMTRCKWPTLANSSGAFGTPCTDILHLGRDWGTCTTPTGTVLGDHEESPGRMACAKKSRPWPTMTHYELFQETWMQHAV